MDNELLSAADGKISFRWAVQLEPRERFGRLGHDLCLPAQSAAARIADSEAGRGLAVAVQRELRRWCGDDERTRRGAALHGPFARCAGAVCDPIHPRVLPVSGMPPAMIAPVADQRRRSSDALQDLPDGGADYVIAEHAGLALPLHGLPRLDSLRIEAWGSEGNGSAVAARVGASLQYMLPGVDTDAVSTTDCPVPWRDHAYVVAATSQLVDGGRVESRLDVDARALERSHPWRLDRR